MCEHIIGHGNKSIALPADLDPSQTPSGAGC
jgi:hypothetical protein